MNHTASPPMAESAFNPLWFAQASHGLDEAGRTLLQAAADWAGPILLDLTGSTGEPLDSHCAQVAVILAGLGVDAQTRASALLAVTPAPGPEVKQDPVQKAFGTEVMTLVRGSRALYRLGSITGQAKDQTGGGDQKEMKRKMLLAMAADLRIVMMRLASRLQSLRWYRQSKTVCPVEFARETLELYTPLANRLGIWQVKWEMEDLAFRFLNPEVYKNIASQLEDKRVERETLISQVRDQLLAALKRENIVAEVSGRPKHIFSIWNKMRNKHLDFEQLFDLRALRVIVDDERSCYHTLAVVHSLWTPVPEEFDDYISRPKPNGYRSLHTVIADAQGRCYEIQIRTRDMHQFAEYGMAAHWRYKEAGAQGGQQTADGEDDRKIAWMRQLLAWDREASTSNAPDPGPQPESSKDAAVEPVLEASSSKKPVPSRPLKAQDDEHIYVLTPQARVIELPVGATPVDFAYYLHTDLGHRCRGARVDGHMVPLSTRLLTGQTVEIVAAKSGGPSRDWLNTQLGFLASPRSRSKVRAWFNAIELQQRISQGQTMVEKELQRLGRTAVNLEQMAQQLGFAKADDLYIAVAKDEFSLRQVDALFREDTQEEEPIQRVFDAARESVSKTGKSGVLVVGVDSLMTQLARCCRPAPPDLIAGFVTRGRGVSIHRADCKSYHELAERQPERAISVDWGDTGDTQYPVDLAIEAQEHPNLLRDLSEVFARLRLNVTGINTLSRRSLTRMIFTIEVRDGEQIQKALAALNELSGVSARRYAS
ncbi:GTP pyrophosphokinase [Alcaligenes pakistanensis]|uniref:GTP pyrophosphokinase n=1 Tax=Alcaligenes pakistanensis TaxID=1482717 RepID=A0A8H9IGZ6_9BURK|nr:bifunctional (p)ppGpp synthetase/guanosine-3',5'-bis(diphosphate) 3'-pyrophosphohydrolase [Alcaligenes pakistanensis]GHC39657.1 GTP pyrophosphokinase [Alcaligenes pakistanensis]